MRRSIAVACVLATSLCVLRTAKAAEVTDVPDAADVIRIGSFEREDNFDLYMGANFEMDLQNGKITREPINRPGITSASKNACTEAQARNCLPVDELRYKRSTSILHLLLEVGLFHDLALTFGWNYYFNDTIKYRYAKGVGPGNSSVDPQTGDPNDTLFPHDLVAKHQGSGALEMGLQFAPLNDERDESKPNWVLAFKVETPWTSETFNPEKQVGTVSNPAPVGDGVYRLHFATALSKRIANLGLIGIDPNANRRGYIDPYMSFEYILPIPGATAVSALKKSKNNPFGHLPSHIARFDAGFEIVPMEDLKNDRKVAIDIGLRTAFYSEGRNYSELTDALHELTFTEQYLHIGGALGLYVQAADFLRIRAGAQFGYNTEHFLTNEDVGSDENNDDQVLRPQDDPHTVKDKLNPFFCGNTATDLCTQKGQPSYDQVGFRFKDEEHVIFTWDVALIFTL